MKTLEEVNVELQRYSKEILLINEKRESLQHNLMSIKRSLADGMLPNHHYKKLLEARSEYKKKLNELNKDSRALKLSKTALENEKSLIISESDNTKVIELKEKLENLKAKYFDFYKDKTRIAYMRKMANEFIVDIDKITREI